MGTVLGALLGLAAPMVSAASSRRGVVAAAQQQTAAQILELFEADGSLTEIVGGAQSPVRRKLYLHAMKLDQAAARDACLNFIALPGTRAGDEELLAAWQLMIDQVSLVYRQAGRRKA
jgi:hypothetical protein